MTHGGLDGVLSVVVLEKLIQRFEKKHAAGDEHVLNTWHPPQMKLQYNTMIATLRVHYVWNFNLERVNTNGRMSSITANGASMDGPEVRHEQHQPSLSLPMP